MNRRIRAVLAGTLLAAGAALVAPAAWQVLVQSPSAAASQQAAAGRLLHRFDAAPSPAPRTAGRPPRIPVEGEPRALAADLAVITVPRFGAGWRRVIRQGVDPDAVLNSFDAGVGHYPGTAMPGGVGAFAIAGHDTGWGDAFRRLHDLRLGDRIEVRTADGLYTYVFRNFQSVTPAAVDVLAPVPGHPGAAPTDRVITITTCDPPFDAQERFVAYGVLASFTPRSHG